MKINLDELLKATTQELKEANSRIIQEIKYRQNRLAKKNKELLYKGSRAKTTGLKGAHNGEMVTVKDVKKTRASVVFDGEKLPYSVPLSCLVPEE
jgi:hypothetical protein